MKKGNEWGMGKVGLPVKFIPLRFEETVKEKGYGGVMMVFLTGRSPQELKQKAIKIKKYSHKLAKEYL